MGAIGEEGGAVDGRIAFLGAGGVWYAWRVARDDVVTSLATSKEAPKG
jgi:hypothetical protein